MGIDRKWVASQGLLALGLAVGTSLPWMVDDRVFAASDFLWAVQDRAFSGQVSVSGWATSIGLSGVSVPVWLIFAAAVFAVVLAALRSADLWDGPPWTEAALLALGVGGCAVALVAASSGSVDLGIGWYVSTWCVGAMAVRAAAALFGRRPLGAARPAVGVPADYLGLRRSRTARVARKKRAAASRVVLPVVEPEPPAAE